MRIDGHSHLAIKKSDIEKYPYGDINGILKCIEKNNMDKVVVFPLDPSYEGNLELMDVIKPYIEKFIPFAFINPTWDNVEEKLTYLLDVVGFKGVKLHTMIHNYDLSNMNLMDKIMKICDERHLHVIIHCTSGEKTVDVDKVEALARAYPNTTIQMAHMGAIFDSTKAINASARTPNLYLDTGIASVGAIKRAIDTVPDKVIMGTDFPFYVYESEIKKIESSCNLSNKDDVLEKVIGKNIENIFVKNNVL